MPCGEGGEQGNTHSPLLGNRHRATENTKVEGRIALRGERRESYSERGIASHRATESTKVEDRIALRGGIDFIESVESIDLVESRREQGVRGGRGGERRGSCGAAREVEMALRGREGRGDFHHEEHLSACDTHRQAKHTKERQKWSGLKPEIKTGGREPGMRGRGKEAAPRRYSFARGRKWKGA